MKPTLKCKLNYLRKNYHDSRIPFFSTSIDTLKLKINWEHMGSDNFFKSLNGSDESVVLIDFMLAKIPEWFCVDCVNKYACELKGTTDETYIKM